MTPKEAKDLITKYKQSIKKLDNNIEIVQPIADLPYSPACIKYALFVYAEEMIKKGLLTEKLMNQLTELYISIETKFAKESKIINANYRRYKDNKNLSRSRFNPRLAIINIGLKNRYEFEEFLLDCQGKYGYNN